MTTEKLNDDLKGLLKSLKGQEHSLSVQDRAVVLAALSELLMATRNLNQQLGALDAQLNPPKRALYLVK
ncbi:hypothetical protein LRS56_06075 [Pseudomonas poae]|nr:hypothetical protein LRS56_06075 [Pseudomonas poae]